MKIVACDRSRQLLDIMFASLRIAGDHRAQAFGQPAAFLQEVERLEQDELPLPAAESSRQQDHAFPRLRMPLRAQLRNALRCDRFRIERAKVDSPRNDDQPLCAARVSGADVVRSPLRIGDHRIAACHHGIVPAFERILRRVNAVIGGDEGNAHAPCRKKRAPGGRTGARMDERNLPLTDQFGEARDIGENRP